MSDAEIVKQDADQASSEPAKLNQPDNAENAVPCSAENASAPAVLEQISPPLATEPAVPEDAKGQDVPEKEVKTPEISNDTASTNGVATEKEIAVDSTEKIVVEDAAIAECKLTEQLLTVAEVTEPATVGAGDTCLLPNLDKKDIEAEKPTKDIGDQLPPSENKPLVDDSLKISEYELTIMKLKDELKKTTVERDCSQRKAQIIEKKLFELQTSYDALLKGEGNDVLLRRMVDQLKTQLVQTSLQLEDRNRVVSNQEKQIIALNGQVSSLKEVESLTRSLLKIRNLEVNQLQTEVTDMETRIAEERERNTTMINKMEAAMKLNSDLKKEYETQLHLFQDLREKYKEKVTLLSEEKRALENVQPVPE
ncbi:uncharacterized protein LOC143208307 [Lasioglossum baleicum]|uniref:uncharacterized protein LOC143208307 n=1 Tax=Lasioglossum baleicum TaxID=434251 RepID=UPI003FCD3C63